MSETVSISPGVNGRRFIPATQWSKFHSWPSLGGLRNLIFKGKENGFDSCIVRVGRRVLIDEARFFQWMDLQKQNEGKTK